MSGNHLTGQKEQARSNQAPHHLTSPVARLIGTPDLWGKIEAFLRFSEAADRSPATIKAYHYFLGDFVRFMNSLGAKMPSDVKEEHVVEYVIHKRKTCNGVSINTCYKHIRAWFNWMEARKLIKKSPLAALKTPTLPRTVIKPLTTEQLQSMLACCTPYFNGIRNKALILLIYDSGLRRNEVTNIRLEDIDLKRGAIKVMGKGARERYVAMGQATRQAIMDYLYLREDSLPWLFVTQLKDRPSQLLPNSITQAIQTIMSRAGITGVKQGPHTLRHSFATAAIRNNANLFYVQSLLGHSKLDMTRRYAATVDSEEAVRQHKNFSPADCLNRKSPSK